MRRNSYFLFFALIFNAGTFISLQAQEKVSYYVDEAGPAREHLVDYEHLRLELDLFPEQQMVKGVVSLHFTPLRMEVDSLWLDAPNIKIEKVMMEGKSLSFKVNEKGVSIFPSHTLERGKHYLMEVQYTAWPRKGLYFSGWDDKSGLHGQIWSQGQGIDNRHWIPHFDAINDKLTTEMIVRFDSAYEVVSNGALIDKKDLGDGRFSWHWKMQKPHASYLIMLAVGNYAYRDTESVSGVPMRQYYYPEWEKNYTYVYRHTEDMMDWLERETGVKYPWENYKQVPVRDFIYGAMENTTATIFADVFYADSGNVDERSYLFVNAHEMAHQWFGDLISAWSPQHHWLQESFATYFHLLCSDEFVSPDRFDYDRASALQTARYFSMMNPYPVAHSKAGTGRHYQKGSQVLHMLRHWVGPELFNESLTYFLNGKAFDNARSSDLMDAFHRTTGYSLDKFWDDWVYRPDEPTVKVWKEVSADKKKRGYYLYFEQDSSTSSDPRIFNLPIDLEWAFEKGEKEKQRFMLTTEKDSFFIPEKKNNTLRYLNIDPGKFLLCKWSIDLPAEWMQTVAAEAERAIDRDFALSLLGEDVRLSMERITAENYGPLRARMYARYFSDSLTAEQADILTADSWYEVRRNLYRSLNQHAYPLDFLKKYYERGLKDGNDNIRSLCLMRLANLEGMDRDSLLMHSKQYFSEVKFTPQKNWYTLALKSEKLRDQSLAELMNYLAPRYQASFRSPAMELLFDEVDDKTILIEPLLDGYLHYDRKYKKACEDYLLSLKEEKNDLKKLKKAVKNRQKKATVQQKERLERLIELLEAN